ncbi:MAG TPA: Gfo/Idh/MocA family oxidoreductase [Opitutaceae bacterium]|nr:Gfo/Idh/MocA family oxidoreductase [Opitutaceae bacterium]
MNKTSRRQFLKTSVVAGVGLATTRRAFSAASAARIAGANDAVRVAVIGMGGKDTVGGVGGRGRQLIASLLQVPGTRIVALCDVDQDFLRREAQPLQERGLDIATHTDLRRVFDDPAIDAVIVATPNHWHGLATVWACQAGKDVYVEKPFSHSIWEGRQMVGAARKHGRIVQTGTQNRSSPLIRQATAELQAGALGPIRYGHAIMYRGRDSIGRVDTPMPVPATLDYDLWCGPAPKAPLRRKQLHYEWHWFWDTGNGEIGNNGVHMMDICRLALGADGVPPRAMSVGGRFAVNDAGETANTQVALLDYERAPLICEIRNLKAGTGGIGTFRNRTRGIIVQCEGGYFAGDSTGGAFYDRQDKKIKDIPAGSAGRLDVVHLANFVAAVRSRRAADLACEAAEGHYSAACCHMANVSHRLGATARPEAIRERLRAQPALADAFERCRQHLAENGVNLEQTPAVLGPVLTYDGKRERFVGDLAEKANALSRREYRAPFVMPEIV